jgi:hypothetical protein
MEDLKQKVIDLSKKETRLYWRTSKLEATDNTMLEKIKALEEELKFQMQVNEEILGIVREILTRMSPKE